MSDKKQRHYIEMFRRLLKLYFARPADCETLVTQSYDRISSGYDESWTNHMRGLTESMINRLAPPAGSKCIDLTCGTGYASELLARRTGGEVIGVDSSGGMLEKARENCGDSCRFVNSDVLDFLRQKEKASCDIITCCWGLGYTKPMSVIREISRVLKPGGKTAVIDNSIFSLREILSCSFLTFAESPEKLENLMRFKFLTGPGMLGFFFRISGLTKIYSDQGRKTYYAGSGKEAIEKLTATGAAAGFEYACRPEDREEIYARFAELIEEKYKSKGKIPITHRYLAGIAVK
ncbi:class I SAM-dependent methyltransferase [Sedimentisphaera salicampi]|uniref:Demethylmenaquinone methyltransferase n=1 Tax=Sedimentisphaera salicampi TaxID=1941349 RepID=A0A1W6LMA5_9BACT|nr:methyltransferase domain-containing protein [Sedimentisphaera salicampi]ARN56891.1 Demethylmenaquinone methyltransferase [Sedimentisphaera salicampi]OXU15060.1 Demethylmenaquinone methyltransferase [Sedimentisphaera salicampi]